MTIAVADALLNGGTREHFIDSMKKFGRLYPDAGYGARFGSWLFSDDCEPYNSWGNGSAMRVSPCAWLMDCGFCARTGMWPSNGSAKLSAEVTHSHPEGIKGALAVTDTIFMCRFYAGGYGDDMENPLNQRLSLKEWKGKIKEHMETEHGYDLSKTLDEIRPTYRFNESCQGTVPEALTAFFESTGFEDAIRNAISLGGDSDTLAAITGSIAEATYGIPQEIADKALCYLDPPLREVYDRWRSTVKGDPSA